MNVNPKIKLFQRAKFKEASGRVRGNMQNILHTLNQFCNKKKEFFVHPGMSFSLHIEGFPQNVSESGEATYPRVIAAGVL